MVNKVYFKDQLVVCFLFLWVRAMALSWKTKQWRAASSYCQREVSRLLGWGTHRCLFSLGPLLAVLCTAGGVGWRRSPFLVTSIFRRKSLTDPDALTVAAGTSLNAEALTEFPLYLQPLSPCSKAEVGLVDSALEELISGTSLLMWFVSLGGHGFKWGSVAFDGFGISESFADRARPLFSL